MTHPPQTDHRVRRFRKPAIALGIGFVAAIPLLTPNTYIHNVLILTFLLAILASGWNIMSGFTGYISLGHSAFIGVGAYTSGILAAQWDLSPLVVAPLGGVAAAFVALLLGLVTSRTRGAAFVIVSFAMLELLGLVTRNWSSLTNGSQGLMIPLPSWDVRFHNWPFYYALLLLVLMSIAMTAFIRRSKLGLGLVAIRDDEDKAAGIGVLTGLYKSIAFMASSVLVGVAGAIYGYYVSFLTVDTMFDIVLSMQVVLAALLGGRGTVWGPILGAAIIVPLSEATNTTLGGADAGALRLIMFGGLLLAVTLLLPRGVIPQVQSLAWFHRRKPAGDLAGSRLVDTPIPETPRIKRARRPVEAGELLTVAEVSMQFGGVKALDHVTLSVPSESITALIGPNGSGKTTLFNVIDGTYTPTSGSIALAGRPITNLGRSQRAFAGVGRTYQLPRLFESMTVLENVAVANSDFQLRRLASNAVSGSEAARATELLEFVGMGQYLDVKATDLSYGQRKLVELAQVLMLDAVVILLDEPAAGINPTLLRRLTSLIRALKDSGRTFVIVEHDMNFVLSLSDHAVVLARGEVLATGKPATVSSNAAVLEAYLGEDFVMDADPIGTGR